MIASLLQEMRGQIQSRGARSYSIEIDQMDDGSGVLVMMSFGEDVHFVRYLEVPFLSADAKRLERMFEIALCHRAPLH